MFMMEKLLTIVKLGGAGDPFCFSLLSRFTYLTLLSFYRNESESFLNETFE
jgi:hypothetical protein